MIEFYGADYCEYDAEYAILARQERIYDGLEGDDEDIDGDEEE